jgi:hypothetical protein
MMYGVDEDNGFCEVFVDVCSLRGRRARQIIFWHHTMGKLDPSDPPTSSNKSDEYETNDTNGET